MFGGCWPPPEQGPRRGRQVPCPLGRARRRGGRRLLTRSLGKPDAHTEEVWVLFGVFVLFWVLVLVWFFGFCFFFIPVRSGYLGSFIELLKSLFFPGGEDRDGLEGESSSATFIDDSFLFSDFFSSPFFPLSRSANQTWVCKVKPKSLPFYFLSFCGVSLNS